MLQRIEPEYRRWLADPAGYVITPAQPTVWPCAVPPRVLSKLASLPDPPDAATLASYAKLAREHGRKPGAYKPDEIESQRIYLLKGGCVAGKLDGDIELLAEYTTVNTSGGDAVRIDYRVLTRVTVAGGVARGQHFRALVQSNARSSGNNFPSDAASANSNFSLGDVVHTPASRSVVISYSRRTGLDRVIVDLHTSVVLPVRGDRWKKVMYSGASLFHESNYKGTKAHGKTISYPYPLGAGKMSDTVETCFDQGESIKSAACDVG